MCLSESELNHSGPEKTKKKTKTMTVCEMITFIHQFIYSFHKSWLKRVSKIIF